MIFVSKVKYGVELHYQSMLFCPDIEVTDLESGRTEYIKFSRNIIEINDNNNITAEPLGNIISKSVTRYSDIKNFLFNRYNCYPFGTDIKFKLMNSMQDRIENADDLVISSEAVDFKLYELLEFSGVKRTNTLNANINYFVADTSYMFFNLPSVGYYTLADLVFSKQFDIIDNNLIIYVKYHAKHRMIESYLEYKISDIDKFNALLSKVCLFHERKFAGVVNK